MLWLLLALSGRKGYINGKGIGIGELMVRKYSSQVHIYCTVLCPLLSVLCCLSSVVCPLLSVLCCLSSVPFPLSLVPCSLLPTVSGLPSLTPSLLFICPCPVSLFIVPCLFLPPAHPLKTKPNKDDDKNR